MTVFLHFLFDVAWTALICELQLFAQVTLLNRAGLQCKRRDLRWAVYQVQGTRMLLIMVGIDMVIAFIRMIA